MRVGEIWRYPVKSMGGERLQRAQVGPFGIDGDRAWGVRDPNTGMVLTARRAPQLLLAAARLVDGDPVITLGDATISGSPTSMSAELSEWFGRRVELIPAGDVGGTFENPRDVDNESDWVAWTGPADAFHDSAKTRVSLVSDASLGDVDIRRVRANLLLTAEVDDRSEDGFVGQRVVAGQVTLEVVKQIDRCIMVTRAQPTLVADREVLKRIIRERSNLLGVGALVASSGSISVGDPVAATLAR